MYGVSEHCLSGGPNICDECCGKIDLFRGQKQGCTYPIMVGILSGISKRGGYFMKDAKFLVILILNIWL